MKIMFLWLSGRALRWQHKGCGFDYQGTHILTKKMYNLNQTIHQWKDYLKKNTIMTGFVVQGHMVQGVFLSLYGGCVAFMFKHHIKVNFASDDPFNTFGQNLQKI